MRRLSIILLMLVLGALTMPSRAAAQQPPQQPPGQLVFTYVTQWNVPRAQWADMGKVFADLKPTVNRLVDDGTSPAMDFSRIWSVPKTAERMGSGLRQVVLPASSKHWPHYSRKRRRVPYWRMRRNTMSSFARQPTDPNREHFKTATFGSPRFL